MMQKDGKELVVQMLSSYLDGQMKIVEFCSAIEEWWNFEADHASFIEEKRSHLDQLFRAVAYHNQNEAERKIFSQFTDEESVRANAGRILAFFQKS